MSTTSIIGHIRNYASAGVVSALVGFLTFPIMTRNLSVDDYGIIGLITASSTLAVALGKLGMQHAIVRYYAEAMHSKQGNLTAFHTTAVTLFLVLSIIATAIWLAAGSFVFPRIVDNTSITKYTWIVSLFIILRMVGSVTWNMLRARQLSADVSYSSIIGRCAYLSMLLILLALGKISLTLVLTAYVLAELAAVAYATFAFKPFWSFRLSTFSPVLTRRLLMFGVPLMVLESLTLLLRLIDRYMIGSVLGDNDLGLYTASYNLSSYIELIFTASLAAAVRPMYTHIWETEGREATKAFLSTSLHNYLMIGIPFITLFIMLAPDLLVLLASHRYQSGTSIIPYIATVFLLDGALLFLSAGVYFLGSTKTLLFWGIVAGIVNVTGNYFVIPRFGIEGAAIVTMISYIVFLIGIINSALRLLMFQISWKLPLLILVISVSVFYTFDRVYVDSLLGNMIIKGAITGCSLVMLVLFIDKNVRSWMATQASALKLKRW